MTKMVHGHFNIRYTHSTFACSVQKYSSLFLYSTPTSEGLLGQHTISIAQLVPKMYLAAQNGAKHPKTAPQIAECGANGAIVSRHSS